MKLKLTLLAISFISTITYGQNVGINTPTPEGTLDVNGDIILRPGELSVSDGATLALDVTTLKFSYYRITGPTADFTIAGIDAGIDGRLVTLFNRSGFAMQLNNEDATAAVTDMIITGTGTDIIIPNKGIVNLQYDAIEQKWIIKSSNKGSASGGSGYWDLNGSDIFNTNTGNVGIGTNNPTAKLTLQTPVNTAGWVHIGGPNEIIVDESIGGVSASVGTMTNHAFRLKSAGTARLHIYPDGKVVVGSNAFGTSNFGRLFIESDLGYGLNHTDGNISVGTYVGGFPETGWFGTISNHPLSFFANNGGALMTILPNGLTGIGTNAPVEKLTVQTLNNTNGISHRGEGGNVISTRIGGTSAGIGTFSNTNMRIFCNSSSAMIIGASNLNIGIGTENPTEKLTVNGTVKSKEVVVETGWADYVFGKNYRLPSLSEVEKFIRQNKHLPNIPSAKQIEKEGLHVGDVQKRMMEKIEELTLYMIEASKQIQDLKKEIEILKTK